MNKQELKKEITRLKERLTALEKLYNDLSPSNERWRGTEGERYCYIGSDGMLYWNIDGNWDSDNIRYELGNYFQSEEEAKFEIERLKVISELKEWTTSIDEFDWKDSYNKKYMIVLESDEVKADYFCSCQTSDLYFKSKEQAEDAIRAIGRERLIKYYFRREDASD